MKSFALFAFVLIVLSAIGVEPGAAQVQVTAHLKPLDTPEEATRLGEVAREFYQKLESDGAGPVRQSVNEGGEPPSPTAIRERFFTGAAAGDNFGWSVSSAGDVNGDGYPEVIVGASTNDAGGSAAGRAYLYFGGVAMDNIADVTLTGAAAGDEFGYSVSSAGDVNGDGYSDVIVGAPNNDAGGSDAGRAYLYFGGAAMDNIADVTLNGTAANDYFGWSVSSAGDVNGDGYPDVIVGAHFNDAGGSAAGRVYLYFGGVAMDNIADVTLTGAAAGDNFGYSVSSAGDVNGDGYSDVVVGAYVNDAGGSSAGRAYLYFGGAAMDNIADVILTGVAGGNFFGCSVSSAGDVNGDGYSDVIVGAYGNNAGGLGAGRAYLYFGGAAMDNIADVTFTGAAAGDFFGASVSNAGDVNGDGYPDVIVGAIYNDAGGADAGRAYLYFGGAAMDNIADVILTGAAAGDNFGRSVSSGGDLNGDGYSDAVVGAYQNDAGGAAAGRAYLYLNSLTGTDIADEFFTGAVAGDQFGYSVSSAGDVNGDGYSDVVVGAYANDAVGLEAGRAYLYFGGTAMDNIADVTFTGAAAGDYFGWSVSGAGDVNGDGYSDVIVGAPFNDAGGADAGRAYLYFGGAAMDNIADVTLTGAAASDQFGISVFSAGDVNGDGYSDIIVGAYGNDAGGSNAGRAYLYFGGAAMDNIADVTLTGAAVGDVFGISVSSGGDVNGDGYSDVIVGAHQNDAGGPDAGRTYLYFGGAAMDNIVDVILTGAAAGDFFGYSVSSAGDVNGDGYWDVIVGAYSNDAGGADAGRAYLYFGGAAMDNIADVTLTGAAVGDVFGISVSSGGDVNGDGYSDVVVGAIFNDVGGADAGRAYLYFGGAAMDNIADVTVTGAATTDYFGYSVSSGGDVNGDGYSDVIVGAYQNDAGGAFAGRAYLYLSSSPSIVPRIAEVKDVPFDQGGKVTVRWIRSGYDAMGIARITDYVVQRSMPPGGSGFAWENIAVMTATQDPQYSYMASTPSDSISSSSGTVFFRVIARTSNPLESWKSNILSGHSADNLPPGSVPDLVAEAQSGPSVRLTWSLNTDAADLGNYFIYRSTTSGFTPSEANKIGSAVDTPFVDSSPPSVAILYYRVRARDVHGNEGDPSPEDSALLGTIQQYSVNASWNLVSVPLSVSDFTKTVLYPTATSDAFAFSGTYVTQSVLENGPGYWLKFSVAQTVSMAGFLRSEDTIAVSTGWNIVGSISSTVAVTSVGSIPGGIVTSQFFGYGSSGYEVVPTIESGKGHWVKVSQNGNLILSSTAPEMAHRIRIIPTEELPPAPPESNEDRLSSGMPTEFSLGQNYPNPFNPATNIKFDIPRSSHTTLRVFDILGREVVTLVNEQKTAGRYEVNWNTNGVTSGVYLYRLEAGSYVETRKMILLR